MPETEDIPQDIRAAGDHVEALLAELGHLPGAAESAEELVRTLVGLYGAGLDRIMEIVTETGAADTLHRLIADDLVSGLLVIHDLHPLTTAERVEAAIDGVRPHLGLHDGGVSMTGITADGVVRLRLTGACHGCPSSQATIAGTIERAIRDAAPEVSGVDVTVTGAGAGPLLQIGPRPPGAVSESAG